MAELVDSGERRMFSSGAVRDRAVGKGRCDLMPLDTISTHVFKDEVTYDIGMFQRESKVEHLERAIEDICKKVYNGDTITMLLELSKHFEEGARKYGDNNWKKGIPFNWYIDSGERHWLKYLRGDKDEPHERAAVWNLICGIWTLENVSDEVVDLPDGEAEEEKKEKYIR